mmetsp:Transcript_20471/g.48149  ORF Transcript_20471/g.48149 Transcript_20471/m.48149 type:complete len:421 (+) Transcript_20471:519-1781(+)
MDDFVRASKTTTNYVKSVFKTLEQQSENKKIDIEPCVKNMIHAYHYWIKVQNWRNANILRMQFPTEQVNEILEAQEIHNQFMAVGDTNKTAMTSDNFTKDSDWDNWSPTFISYLAYVPGITELPLNYVVHGEAETQFVTPADTVVYFTAVAPLEGKSFDSDSLQVFTSLIQCISKNTNAMSIVKALGKQTCSHASWLALQTHYRGSGVYRTKVTNAERVLGTLIYTGERKPQIWWLEFVRQLNSAFATIEASKGKQVFSEGTKLRKLLQKIKCDWLDSTKAIIRVELCKEPLRYTYAESMIAFKNTVLEKFPNNPSDSRTIFQTWTKYHAKKRPNTHKGFRKDSHTPLFHQKPWEITLKTRKWIQYSHAKYLAPEDFRELPDAVREACKNAQINHRNNNNKRGNSNSNNRQNNRQTIAEL